MKSWLRIRFQKKMQKNREKQFEMNVIIMQVWMGQVSS